jgi:hypothetical protein
MSDIWIPVGGQNVVTVRLEPDKVNGRDMAGQPALYLPLQLQILPVLPAGQNRDVPYSLVRLGGKLQNQPLGEFASFEVGPLCEAPNPTAFFRQQEALVSLDRLRIKRFEEARAGDNAYFQIMLSCLVWYPTQNKFEVTRPIGYLEVKVSKSDWVEKVVSKWNLSNLKIVEISFPTNATGDNFRAAYAKVESAEKLFANGQWKQTLAELYSAFEGLAKSFGYNKPDQQFFVSLASGLHPAKKEGIKLALDAFCDLLHLGRHEPKQDAETFSISPADARFALTMSYAIFEYVTPKT